ncbi:MAG: hypothetical protein H7Z37_00415 [Pyrinomonadaceae bacterium]|nr:hypothetical protein [Pyrinomonadaceae bacterium]
MFCNAEKTRATAKFCRKCGREVIADDSIYVPLADLKASYNLKNKSLNNTRQIQQNALFATNKNGASTTAIAFVVYSLVPFLGILFCPGALFMSVVGLSVSFAKPHLGGRETSVLSLFFGSFITLVQLLLWWLLFLIPELRR